MTMYVKVGSQNVGDRMGPGRYVVLAIVALTLALSSIPLTVPADEGPGPTSNRAMIDKIVLGEMFTATWCTPCIDADAGMDMVLEAPGYFDERFVLVEYHSNDEYSIPEGEARSSYYFVTGIPTAVFDGQDKVTGDSGTPEDNAITYMDTIDNRPDTSYLSIDIETIVSGRDGETTVKVEVEQDLPLTQVGLTLYAVLVEDHNVKLETGHILRMTAVDMPIENYGVILRNEGDNITLQQDFQVDSQWHVEDLAIVAWVQNENTREVLQAGIGYAKGSGGPGENAPPNYIGGDLNFSMGEDTVSSNIYMDSIFQDPDGDPLSFSAEGALHINVTVDQETKALRVTPALDWSGTETIYASARDNEHPWVSHPVTVTVTPVSDPPRLIGSLTGLVLDEDTSSSTSSLSSIFHDPDGDQLSYQIENMVHLMVVKNSDNTLSITPKEDWNGYENLVVRASDGEFETTYDDVIRVNPVNDEPQITGYHPMDYTEIEEGGLLTLSVTAEDIEGDTLTYIWELDGVDIGVRGSSFTYEPEYGDSGEHVILVKVTDGSDITSHAFQIIVIEGNRPPTIRITSPVEGQVFNEGDMVIFLSDVLDPDDPYGKDLEYRWTLDGVIVGTDTQLTKRPKKGTHTISLRVTDGEYEVSDSVTFKVKEKGSSGLPGFGTMSVLVSILVCSLMLTYGRRK